MHFWLHHNAHCAEKIVSASWRTGSVSAERVQQGEVGGVTHRMLCTWWLGCERAMAGTEWAISCLNRMDRLRKHYTHHVGWFLPRKTVWALSRCMTTYIVLTIAYSLISGLGQVTSLLIKILSWKSTMETSLRT